MNKHEPYPYKTLPYSISFQHPLDGINYMCPLEWISDDLGVPVGVLLAYMSKSKMSLTHYDGHGFGITNLDIKKFKTAFGTGEE